MEYTHNLPTDIACQWNVDVSFYKRILSMYLCAVKL